MPKSKRNKSADRKQPAGLKRLLDKAKAVEREGRELAIRSEKLIKTAERLGGGVMTSHGVSERSRQGV